MKKTIILGLSLLTILSLTSVNAKTHETPTLLGNENVQVKNPSHAKNYSYHEYGKKSATTKTVTCYANLPGDEGKYATVYVEPDQTLLEATGRQGFRCTISGHFSSEWFLDRFGCEPFDVNSKVTEDMSLYGYTTSKKEDPDITVLEQEGKYTIKWEAGKNVSFVASEGGSLPLKADENVEVKFKLAYNFSADKKSIVSVDGVTIDPDDNGVYTVKITKNTTIKATGVEIVSVEDTYTYTLHVSGHAYPLTKSATKPSEYMIEKINLQVNDTFYVERSDGEITDRFDKALEATGSDIKYYDFRASEAGKYSFYFDTTRLATWVAQETIFKITNVPNWLTERKAELDVYAWVWEEGADGQWVLGEISDNNTLLFASSKSTYGIIPVAVKKGEQPASDWSNLIGRVPEGKDIKTKPGQLSYEAKKWNYVDAKEDVRDYYFVAPESWKKVYAHQWGLGGTPNGSWPGKLLTPVDEAKRLYKVNVDITKYNWIIFNSGNGNPQTVNIDLSDYDADTEFGIGAEAKEKNNYEITTKAHVA